jgi:hypothetical protein
MDWAGSIGDGMVIVTAGDGDMGRYSHLYHKWNEVRVSVDANLGSLEVLVEEVEHVNVSGSKLSCVHFKVTKHTRSLINRGREGAADVRFTITRNLASVLPTILFWHRHKVID